MSESERAGSIAVLRQRLRTANEPTPAESSAYRASGGTSTTLSATLIWGVGLLWGLAAGIAGVEIHGLRPSHVLFVLGLVISLAWFARTGTWATWRPGWIECLGLLFVVGSLAVERFNSVELGYEANWFSAMSPAIYIVEFSVARHLVRSGGSGEALLSSFTAFVPIASSIAIAQALWPQLFLWVVEFAPSPTTLEKIENDELVRATGLIGHWTGLGYYFSAMIAGMCVLLVLRRKSRRDYWWTAFSLVCALFGVVATFTIAPIVTAAITIAAVWFLVGLRPRFAALGALAVATVLLLVTLLPGIQDRFEQQATPSSVVSLPSNAPAPSNREEAGDAVALPHERDPNSHVEPVTEVPPKLSNSGTEIPAWLPSTIQWRLHVWAEQTIPSIEERPWTGWGLGIYSVPDSSEREVPSSLKWGSAESQGLWLAINMGVPLAIIYCLFLGAAVAAIARGAVRADASSVLLVGFMLLLIAGSTIVPLFTNRGIPLALWVIVGITVGALQKTPTHH